MCLCASILPGVYMGYLCHSDCDGGDARNTMLRSDCLKPWQLYNGCFVEPTERWFCLASKSQRLCDMWPKQSYRIPFRKNTDKSPQNTKKKYTKRSILMALLTAGTEGSYCVARRRKASNFMRSWLSKAHTKCQSECFDKSQSLSPRLKSINSQRTTAFGADDDYTAKGESKTCTEGIIGAEELSLLKGPNN